MKIVTRTLSDQAFEVIRERILSTRIPPLAPIRQDALAEELGISKIPLREALARLEQDGLLASHVNRGYFVPALTAAEAEEVFALRLKIEPEAAAAASLDADDAQRDAAKAALVSLEAAGHGATPGIVSLNRAFHLSLVQPGGRQITSQLVERLHVLAERYVRKHLEPEGRDVRADSEHRAILKAWLARDAKRVAALLAQHITMTLDDLRLQLREGAAASEAAPSRVVKRNARAVASTAAPRPVRAARAK
ncbi:DNA-binding GntR family transcriptional regulator [Luteimonas cucumeris]|uniref:DNA-binding GntR family transcriptional regulator n=1 Tax=Luteimonas cucumeris TaxID=985012 RepID=A0A562LBH9_9GAMM|nr:GntR family transcriptional regulator [Luteimonas cucumeris]TWI04991.1 DNA-binding GntR family transcriptional regulator [Luteimonas cucumeris]